MPEDSGSQISCAKGRDSWGLNFHPDPLKIPKKSIDLSFHQFIFFLMKVLTKS